MAFKYSKYLNNSLIKDTFVYTITDGVGKAIGFLLLPLVSFYVTPDELGIATNFMVLVSIVTLLGGMAIVNSLPYFYYEQTKEHNRSLISTLLFLCLLSCAILSLIVLSFYNFISYFLQLDVYLQLYAIITVIMTLIGTTNLNLLRLRDKAKTFAVLQLLQIIIQLVLVIIFVVVLRWGGRGKIYADTGAVIILAFPHLWMMLKGDFIEFKISTKDLRRLVKFGAPLLPHSISFWLKSGVDKILITHFSGLYYNGLYSMAMTLTSVYGIISQAFFRSYVPFLQKKLSTMTMENSANEKRKIVLITYVCIIGFFLLSLLSIAAIWLILKYLVNSKYLESFVFIPWLIIGLFIYSVYSFTIEFIYKQKKTLMLGIITFSGSLIQMLLCYMLIKTYGVMGAAYSSVIGAIIISIGIFIYSNKVYPMPWFSLQKNCHSC